MNFVSKERENIVHIETWNIKRRSMTKIDFSYLVKHLKSLWSAETSVFRAPAIMLIFFTEWISNLKILLHTDALKHTGYSLLNDQISNNCV